MNSNYIKNEKIVIADGQVAFNLSNQFKAGTVKIIYNGRLFYDYRESLVSSSQILLDSAGLSTDDIVVSYHLIQAKSTLNAIRYITTRQIKDYTRIGDLENLGSLEMEKLIRESEYYIDALVGAHKKYYEWNSEEAGQMRTFPRIKDDPDLFNSDISSYPFIPMQITTAALYAVENLFLKGVQTQADDGAGPIISKKLGDFSYTKAQPTGLSSDQIAIIDSIGRKSFSMLNGFIKKTGTLAQEKGVNRPLNSRQLFIQNNPYI